MIRALLKLILIVIVVVAIGAFFFGYRWAAPRATAGPEPTRPTGTAGTAADERQRAREVGADIGENVAAGTNAAQRALSNAQLTAKIKSKMALDDTIQASDIDVDTADGVVTLSGVVSSTAQRQRALQLARETDGVLSVIDRLQVQ